MNLQEILQKESVNDQDIAFLVKNMRFLSLEDKIRFGFAAPEEVVAEEVPKKKKITK